MDATLDRANSDRIGDEKGFKPGLDGEQAGDLAKLGHRLSKRHETGAVPPFPD